jgi:cbb3-type cytochrome oxidase subunit 1
MTRLSVWTVRTALLYLGVGFLLGALMLTQKGLPSDLLARSMRLLPLHVEVVLFGWTLQLAMGIAFWILPRFSREPRYGNQAFGWLAFVLLNVGVLCAGLGQWLGAEPAVALLGRLAEACAVIFFLGHAWPRVRPTGL